MNEMSSFIQRLICLDPWTITGSHFLLFFDLISFSKLPKYNILKRSLTDQIEQNKFLFPKKYFSV